MSLLSKIMKLFGHSASTETPELHDEERPRQAEYAKYTKELTSASDNSFPEPDPNFEPDYSKRPEAVRIFSDEFHLKYFGSMEDGKIVWITTQLFYDHKLGKTTDYICLYIFNERGALISNDIRKIGVRGAYDEKFGEGVFSELMQDNPIVSEANTLIQTFSIEFDDREFGLIAIPPEFEDEEWRVLFMPGNTMAFYPPFDSGLYDT